MVKDTILGFIEPHAKTSELFLDLNLHCKWGFDGSTGQSQYKQYQIIQQALMIILIFYHVSSLGFE